MKFEDFLPFVMDNAVVWLFVFIYGRLSERKLIPRKISLKNALVVLMIGITVSSFLQNRELSYLVRSAFLITSLLIFNIAVKATVRVTKEDNG